MCMEHVFLLYTTLRLADLLFYSVSIILHPWVSVILKVSCGQSRCSDQRMSASQQNAPPLATTNVYSSLGFGFPSIPGLSTGSEVSASAGIPFGLPGVQVIPGSSDCTFNNFLFTPVTCVWYSSDVTAGSGTVPRTFSSAASAITATSSNLNTIAGQAILGTQLSGIDPNRSLAGSSNSVQISVPGKLMGHIESGAKLLFPILIYKHNSVNFKPTVSWIYQIKQSVLTSSIQVIWSMDKPLGPSKTVGEELHSRSYHS